MHYRSCIMHPCAKLSLICLSICWASAVRLPDLAAIYYLGDNDSSDGLGRDARHGLQKPRMWLATDRAKAARCSM